MVGIICAQIFDPFLVLITLVAVNTGLLIAAQFIAVVSQRHKAGDETIDEEKLDDERIIARLFDFDVEEPLSHDRNTEIVVAHLAASLGGHPPRSPEEFLNRLDLPRLREKLGPQACSGISQADVERVRMQLRALCAHFGRALDGEPPSEAQSSSLEPATP